MRLSFRIERLSTAHDRTRFESGSLPLDRYLREHASQDIKRRMATCFVAVNSETGELAGFYTITAASVALGDFDPEIVKKLPRYPVVPAVLMGRLAIDRSYQGQGLGSTLLGDALLRSSRAELGVFAMLVDAKDEAAQRFYERYGFTPLPSGKALCGLP